MNDRIELFIRTQDHLNLYVRPQRVNKPKAVLVHTHGWCEHTGRHVDAIEPLNDAGYSLYLYDARGHGRSDGRRGYTPSVLHMVDDLNRIVQFAREDSGCKTVFVSGNSMGGGLALNYAANNYAGLAGVIATSPWLRLVFQPKRWMVRVGRSMGRVIPTFSMAVPKGRRATLVRDGSVDARIELDPMTHRRMSARLYFGMLAFGESLIAHADAQRVPTLLQHGTADRVTSHMATQEYLDRMQLADKAFLRYEGAYHELHSDIRERFYSDMVHWLDIH